MNRVQSGIRANRGYLAILGLVLAAAVLTGASLPERDDPSNEIVADAMKVAKQQQETLPPYSVLRRYTLSNRHLSSPVAMQVRWRYVPGAGRQFEIVDSGSATGIARDALLRLLNDEAESSKLASDPAAVTPAHYNFESAATDEKSYKIRLTPKVNTKYLLNGFAYIGRDGGSFTRVQGTTSRRISFWVGKATVSQEFACIDGYWLPSRTHSVADVRLIGPTELTIEASDYQFGVR